MKNFFRLFLHGDFAVSFWSSFLSALVLWLLTILIVYIFTDLLKSPKLKIVVKQNGFYRDSVLLTKTEQGVYEASFHLAIKNFGNKTLGKEEGYWHIFVESTDQGSFSAQGEKNHQRGLIDYPVYPDSFVDIGPEYRFSLTEEQIKDATIPYFLSTVYNYFPKSVKMDQQTGEILFENMGHIKFEIEG